MKDDNSSCLTAKPLVNVNKSLFENHTRGKLVDDQRFNTVKFTKKISIDVKALKKPVCNKFLQLLFLEPFSFDFI